MFRIARLIERIVPSNPRIVFVSYRDLLPEPNRSILVIFVIPKCRISGRVVGVPVWVLATGDGMQVEDSIYALCCALKIVLSVWSSDAINF